MVSKPVIGILGAGKLGTALARLAIEAGYKVLISGSKDAERIALTVEILVPGATPLTSQEVVLQADIILLALPLSKFPSIPNIEDKIIIDAMNYWMEVDGVERIPANLKDSSSEIIARHFPKGYVVKAFNHMGYHDLEYEAHQPNTKVIAYATDFEDKGLVVATLIKDMGFEPLYIGTLKQGIKLEPGSELFGANLVKKDFETQLQDFESTDFGKKVLTSRNGKF